MHEGLRPNSLVVDKGEHGPPMPGCYVFVGEIPNRPGHGVFIGHPGGKVYVGLHLERFREATAEEW